MKQNYEKVVLERLKLISEHFETPKRLDSFEWVGTSLLQNFLCEKKILIKTETGGYRWKRNPDGEIPLPVTGRLAKTLVESIRLKQAHYKEARKLKVIIKNKPLTLWQKLVAWWQN